MTRIIKIFELKSCLKMKEKHRTSAIIRNELLQKTLRLFSLINAILMSVQMSSELQFSQFIKLNCLYNRYRIVAA